MLITGELHRHAVLWQYVNHDNTGGADRVVAQDLGPQVFRFPVLALRAISRLGCLRGCSVSLFGGAGCQLCPCEALAWCG
jgi:hypothetical protein